MPLRRIWEYLVEDGGCEKSSRNHERRVTTLTYLRTVRVAVAANLVAITAKAWCVSLQLCMHQLLGVGVLRIFENLIGQASLDDSTAAHDDHSVGKRANDAKVV